jgi:hypothetical protein
MADIHPARFFSLTLVGMRYNAVEAKDVLSHVRFNLKPEPSNKYDKNAVQVFSEDGLLLGHVSRSSLGALPELTEEGEKFDAVHVYRESLNAIRIVLQKN